MVIDLYDAIAGGTYHGITVTKNTDRSVTVTGEPDITLVRITSVVPLNLPNGTTLSTEYPQDVKATLAYKPIGSEAYSYVNLTSPQTIDLDNNTNYEIYIEVIRASFTSPATFTPLVRSSKGLCSNYRAMVRRRDIILANQRVQTQNTLYLYYLGDNENAWHFTGKDQSESSYSFESNHISEYSVRSGVYVETINRIDTREYVLFGGRFNTSNMVSEDYFVHALCTNGDIHNENESFGRVMTNESHENGSQSFVGNISGINGDYYVLIWTQKSSYGSAYSSKTYAVYLAKQDDISPLAMYGNTEEAIIANASSLFTSGMAVTAMVKTCTGSFMWKALADSGFVTAMRASSFYATVQNNPEWSKAIVLLDY